jgi:hypothetical protein
VALIRDVLGSLSVSLSLQTPLIFLLLYSIVLSFTDDIFVHLLLKKTVILSVVLYGCETWSLTLREEHRLGDFENRVLRRIFGPERE